MINGDEILQYYNLKLLNVDPWDENKIGTNSYDITLGKTLLRYTSDKVDPKLKNPTEEVIISDKGFTLNPGDFVLGSTAEFCTNLANNLVPMIEGRSSIARLGLNIHVCAGFGDVGYCGRWTLELFSFKKINIYAGMPIGQLYWLKTTPTERKYKGKYQMQDKPKESHMFQELNNEKQQ